MRHFCVLFALMGSIAACGDASGLQGTFVENTRDDVVLIGDPALVQDDRLQELPGIVAPILAAVPCGHGKVFVQQEAKDSAAQQRLRLRTLAGSAEGKPIVNAIWLRASQKLLACDQDVVAVADYPLDTLSDQDESDAPYVVTTFAIDSGKTIASRSMQAQAAAADAVGAIYAINARLTGCSDAETKEIEWGAGSLLLPKPFMLHANIGGKLVVSYLCSQDTSGVVIDLRRQTAVPVALGPNPRLVGIFESRLVFASDEQPRALRMLDWRRPSVSNKQARGSGKIIAHWNGVGIYQSGGDLRVTGPDRDARLRAAGTGVVECVLANICWARRT